MKNCIKCIHYKVCKLVYLVKINKKIVETILGFISTKEGSNLADYCKYYLENEKD